MRYILGRLYEKRKLLGNFEKVFKNFLKKNAKMLIFAYFSKKI